MPTPEEIFGVANIYADYDPTSLVGTYAFGDPVQTWVDSTGTHSVSQATAAKRPTLQQVTHNGKTFPVLRFDKTDDGLQTVDLENLAQPTTTIVVVRPTSTVNQRLVDTANTAFRNLTDLVSAKWRMFGSSALSSAESANTNWNVILAIFNGSASNIRSNGGTPTTGNVGTVGNQGTTIGIDAGGSSLPLGGDIARVIRLRIVPTPEQVVALDSYVQDTYGVAVADYDAGGGEPEAKSTTGTISLGLASAGTVAKHTASAVALGLTVTASAGDEKTGATAAPLTATLDVAALAAKGATSATALPFALGLDGDAAKATTTAATFPFALDAAGTTEKAGATNGSLGFTTAISGETTKTEQPTEGTASTIPIRFTTTGGTVKHAATLATAGFGLTLAGTVTKYENQPGTTNGSLALSLGIGGQVVKRTGTAAAVGFSLATAGTTAKTAHPTALLGFTIDLAGTVLNPERVGPVPASRTYIVDAELRVWAVPAENRTITA